MIKGIIFDFDYTLSDRSYALYIMYQEIVKKYFKDLDEIEQEGIIQKMISLDEQATISRDHTLDYMYKHYGIDLKEDFSDLSYRMAPYTKLAEGAIEVLDYLKKHTDYKLAILTNGNVETQLIKIDSVNIKHYFDLVVPSLITGFSKPDPRAFEYVAKELGLKCEECLYVGDVYFNDIVGAHRAKMPHLLVNNERKRTYGSHVKMINHLTDLIEYISKEENDG